jgi:hypothetical protein
MSVGEISPLVNEPQANAPLLARARPRPVRSVALAVVASIVLATLIYAAHAAILLPPLALALVVWALPERIGIGTRVLFGAVAAIGWTIAITAILQPLHLGLHPLFTWGSLAVVATFARTYFPRAVVLERTRGWADVVPVIVAVIALGFLASAGAVQVGVGGRGVEQRMGLIAGAEDGASHYAIFDTILQVHGFAYGADARRISAQWPYPPGFHLVAATLAESLDHTAGTSAVLGGPVDAFWISSLMAFSLLVAAAGGVAVAVARRGGAGLVASAVAGGVCGAAALLWLPFSLLQSGFMPQILALAVMLVALMAMILDDVLGYRWTLAILALSFAVISWVWYFPIPVLGLLVLAWMLVARRQLAVNKLYSAALAITAIAASVVPFTKSTAAVTVASVNAGGGVAAIPTPVIVGVAMVAFGGVLMLRDRRSRTVLTLAVIIPSAFSIAFHTYQVHTIGSGAYFYFKSLYTILVVAMPIAFGAVAALIAAGAGVGRWRVVAATAILLVGASTALGIRVDSRGAVGAWLYRDGALASKQRPTFARYVGRRHDIDGRFVIAWDVTGVSTDDYLASRWLSAFNGRASNQFFAFIASVVYAQDDTLLVLFMEDHPKGVTVITGDPTLRKRLVRLGLDQSAVDSGSILQR